MTVTMDQFDGEFKHVTAADVRQYDVILGGARMVKTPPVTNDGRVTIATAHGTETFDTTAPVYVYRPAAGSADDGCTQCGAEPGDPCTADCLGCALLDDAAGTAIA